MIKTQNRTEYENRYKRLLYRSHRRGTQEMDVLLGSFVRSILADNKTACELTALEHLVARSDAELYGFLSKQARLPEEADADMLRAFILSCG